RVGVRGPTGPHHPHESASGRAHGAVVLRIEDAKAKGGPVGRGAPFWPPCNLDARCTIVGDGRQQGKTNPWQWSVTGWPRQTERRPRLGKQRNSLPRGGYEGSTLPVGLDRQPFLIGGVGGIVYVGGQEPCM